MSLFLGIDVGSVSTEALLLDEALTVRGKAVLRTSASGESSAAMARDTALTVAGAAPEHVAFSVATGYGRVSVPFASKVLTEITCHARGAHHLISGVATVVDVGGQDAKVIRVSPDGWVDDFQMNDKCAAGTGRFLEVMARTLDLPLEELGPESLRGGRELTVSSTCTVFAESEVVALIGKGKPRADIASAVERSIASRIGGLARLVGVRPVVVMTGGVAHNAGMVRFLEEALGHQIVVPPEPEMVGALGAALLASEQARSRPH